MNERSKGLFDRSTKGKSTEPVEVLVERGRIQFFAQVLGEADPIHSDLAAARDRGYPDLVAPPSFFVVMEAMADAERAKAGRPSSLELIGADFKYLLHGDEAYEYAGPILAGDAITVSTTVEDFYEKKGGLLEFATLRSVATHRDRGVLIRATRTLLHRLG